MCPTCRWATVHDTDKFCAMCTTKTSLVSRWHLAERERQNAVQIFLGSLEEAGAAARSAAAAGFDEPDSLKEDEENRNRAEREARRRADELVEYEFDTDWGSTNWTIHTLQICDYKLVDESYGKVRCEKVERRSAQLKKAPFAKGANRLAYHMILQTPTGQERWVAKLPRGGKDYEEEKREVEEAIETQMFVAELARRYTIEASKKKLPSIEYVVIKLAKIETAMPRAQCMSIEPMLPAGFVKYNNLDDPTSAYPDETPQAFSHFTWCITRGNALVVDVQGCLSNPKSPPAEWKYVMTDPALHTSHPGHSKRFGTTNKGLTAIDRFMSEHKCNSTCKALGLQPHPRAAPSVTVASTATK